MQFIYKGKNMEVTEALRSYVEKRLAKFGKYFDSPISADVMMSTERSRHIIEVTVFANGFVLRGEERTKDMYTSIDKVADKLESQIKRHKGKVTNKKGRHGGSDVEEEGAVAVAVAPPPGEGEVLSVEPHVERVYRFEGTPLTLEQAVKELEARDYTFFCFQNLATNRFNVLYKRQRGYGLIDPS